MLTVAKLFAGSILELRTDEAYHWAWSKEWVVSYLDHPPMVAWLVRLGTSLFGDSLFGARFAFLLAMPIAELLLADIVRRRTGSLQAAATVVLAMESTIHLGGIAMLIEPSIPLILFSSLMFWALSKLEQTGDALWWLLVGAAAGLALLSKYMALLFVPAILAFLLVPPRNRRWLFTPWPWIAGVISLLLFAPVLWWNFQNDWASFRFQGVRAVGGHGMDLGNLTDFLALSLLLIGPVLAPLVVFGSIRGAIRAFREADGTTLAISVAFLFFFGYLAIRALSLDINTSWPVAMWPFGIAAAAIGMSHPVAGTAARLPRTVGRWWLVAICINLVLLAGAHYHVTLDAGAWGGNRDPIGRDDGYAAVGDAVIAMAESGGYGWVATTDYRTYAALRWQLRGRLPVYQINQRSRYIGFAATDLEGTNGLYVYPDGRADELVPGDGGVAAERIWREQNEGTMIIRPVDGWSPDLTPPRDSPLYRWPDLA
ncbi:glycosyltransferase family 39 protein [Devosia sp.]|uniref:glycosyltransferase family 39 protein n=1 Tax=Devosia sp. TaxID=1871048 RepID=UPI00260AEA35|nr:glycosyltransferase family 39 protein [Devosia sp.]